MKQPLISLDFLPSRLRRGVACAGLCLLYLGLAACGQPNTPAAQAAATLWQAEPGAALLTAHGPLPLEDLRGKPLLVSFGYLHCPDICPTNLGASAQVLARLQPAERERVRVLFVSVDPERDTAAAMQAYLAFFHPEIRGLRVNGEALKPIARAFRVVYQRQPVQDGGAYAIDHSAQWMLINAEGRLVRLLPYATPPDDLAAALRDVR